MMFMYPNGEDFVLSLAFQCLGDSIEGDFVRLPAKLNQTLVHWFVFFVAQTFISFQSATHRSQPAQLTSPIDVARN